MSESRKNVHAAQTRTGGKKTAKSRKKNRYSRSVRVAVTVMAALMAVVAVVFIGGGAYVWNLLNKLGTGIGSPNSYETSLPEGEEAESIPDYVFETDPYENATTVADIPLMGDTDDVTNILLIGIDGRTNYSARSDSNMILSINKAKKTIKLVSLLRDTCVTIPGRDNDGDGKDDYNKLNAAYAWGQEDLLFRTIEQNFRLSIDYYVGVNFVVFPIAVDALGGIEIELTDKEVTQVPAAGCRVTVETGEAGFVPIGKKGGTYTLDGFQTLQYCRIRHIDSDFGRVQRQQKVVKILLDKARNTSAFTLMGMLEDLFPQVKTNMSKSMILDYIVNVGSYLGYEIQTTYHIPQDGQYRNENINGGAMLVLNDPKQSVTELHEYLYG